MSIHKDEDKQVKVIAGKFEKAEGPVKKHNVEPIYFDVELNGNKNFKFKLPKTHNSFIYLIEGEIKIGDNEHKQIKDSTLISWPLSNKISVESFVCLCSFSPILISPSIK